MRLKLTALIGGVLSAAAIAAAAATSTPAAHAATLSPASSVSSVHAAHRYTAHVTLRVRCGKFVGHVDHGGIGGILDPAYLAVHGKLSSSCNSTTYLQIKYNVGFTDHGPVTIRKAGPHKTVNVDWQIKSRNGEFADIAVRVGTTDGMPKGQIHWGAWKHV
jgi:hypothetical protein